MAERSGRNSFLASVTLATPALVGFGLGLYEASRFQGDIGISGISFPEIVPGPLFSLHQEVISRTIDFPGLSWLAEKLIENDLALGLAMFSAISWTLFLCIPLIAWGYYLHWWSDEGLASRGGKVQVAAWLVAVPGMILGFFAALASVVLLVAVAILGAIAWSTFRKEPMPKTAVDDVGNLLKKRKDGSGYNDVKGVLGQKRDTNIFGQPNTENKWGSPQEVRRNPFGPGERTQEGRKVYRRKDEEKR